MAKRKEVEHAKVNLKIESEEDRVKFGLWLDQGILACENAIASLKVQYKASGADYLKANIKHYKARISGYKWLKTRMNPKV